MKMNYKNIVITISILMIGMSLFAIVKFREDFAEEKLVQEAKEEMRNDMKLCVNKALLRAQKHDGEQGLSLKDEDHLVEGLLGRGHVVIFNQPFNLKVIKTRKTGAAYSYDVDEITLTFSGEKHIIPLEDIMDYLGVKHIRELVTSKTIENNNNNHRE